MKITDSTVAFVTGAASGLGLATARALLEAGASVVLADRDGPGALEAEFGDQVLVAGIDVSQPDSVQDAVERAKERFGALHVTVNAAGIAPGVLTLGRRGMHDLDQFRKTFDVNVIGLFDVCRRTADVMQHNEPDENGERGVIINVSSGAAWQGQRGQAAYSGSKAAVIGMMLPMAKDLAPYGIRVTSVAPGPFDTAMAAGFSEKTRTTMNDIPLHPKRMGRPEEFADLALHIVRNPYLNATSIDLDGGARIV